MSDPRMRTNPVLKGIRVQEVLKIVCPDHRSIAAIMACPRCSAVFWARQSRLKAIDDRAL